MPVGVLLFVLLVGSLYVWTRRRAADPLPATTDAPQPDEASYR
jgi:hypothetical protein